MNNSLGDRMKEYESAEAGRRFIPLVPIIARMDGRSFHSFTRGMERPYSKDLSECMIGTAKLLLQETNACMAYTQSDEITLAWLSSDPKSQIWFDGRVAKMTSQLGALCTLYFYQLVVEKMPLYAKRNPTFDARVWQVPTKTEAANAFLWRERDATKNSITMAASAFCSHNQLHEKNSSEKYQMLWGKGINWNDYPAFFKRGTFIQRRKTSRRFTAEELIALPLRHEARTNPRLMVERSEFIELDMPSFDKVINREAVIFDGAEPLCAAEIGKTL